MKALLDDKFKPLAGNPDKVTVLDPASVEAIVKECADQPLDRQFLDKAYDAIAQYRRSQAGRRR